MKIHKEGYKIIFYAFILIGIVVAIICFIAGYSSTSYWATIIGFLLWLSIVSFFRFPNIPKPEINEESNNNNVIAPADGKIVIVKKVFEGEYLKRECMQVSIFMGVHNVHINWFPIDGIVKYYKYHPGKYLVAMHEKSSEKNERTSIVVENRYGTPVLFRQIAGYIARRIVCYAEEDKSVAQGDQVGFIKFGSRIDLFLPLDSKIQVTKGQLVKGRRTIIAKLPDNQL